jgi:hypothetical protein
MSLCDFEDRTKVYLGYGNVISLIPMSDLRTGSRMDMTDATEVRVCIGGVVRSSLVDPDLVWWSEEGVEGEPGHGWLIHFRPGLFVGLGSGEQEASVVVFNTDFPAGVVLTNSFPLLVEGVC